MVSAGDGWCVVKLCAALAGLVTPLARSCAKARQKYAVSGCRSVVGTKPVSFTPSVLLPRATSGVNDDEVAISKRYVMAPAGPVRVTLLTRSAGRVPVCAPLSGAIGAGVPSVIAGPIVNREGGPKTPVVPPPKPCTKRERNSSHRVEANPKITYAIAEAVSPTSSAGRRP